MQENWKEKRVRKVIFPKKSHKMAAGQHEVNFRNIAYLGLSYGWVPLLETVETVSLLADQLC